MIRRPPRSTRVRSSAASDVYKRQVVGTHIGFQLLNTHLSEIWARCRNFLLSRIFISAQVSLELQALLPKTLLNFLYALLPKIRDIEKFRFRARHELSNRHYAFALETVV